MLQNGSCVCFPAVLHTQHSALERCDKEAICETNRRPACLGALPAPCACLSACRTRVHTGARSLVCNTLSVVKAGVIANHLAGGHKSDEERAQNCVHLARRHLGCRMPCQHASPCQSRGARSVSKSAATLCTPFALSSHLAPRITLHRGSRRASKTHEPRATEHHTAKPVVLTTLASARPCSLGAERMPMLAAPCFSPPGISHRQRGPRGHGAAPRLACGVW